jgi:hypothetical protein
MQDRHRQLGEVHLQRTAGIHMGHERRLAAKPPLPVYPEQQTL